MAVLDSDSKLVDEEDIQIHLEVWKLETLFIIVINQVGNNI